MNWANLHRGDANRRALQAGVFFLIGATINIAVAWGCAFRAAPSNDMEGWSSDVSRPNLAAAWVGQPKGFPERSLASGTVYPRRAGVRKSHLWGDNVGFRYEDYEDARAYTKAFLATDSYSLALIDAGWPFASFEGGLWRLRGAARIDFDQWQTKQAILVDRGSFVNDDWTIIPLMPKWPGFLANSVFFGGIVFLLFRSQRALRGRRLPRVLAAWTRRGAIAQ